MHAALSSHPDDHHGRPIWRSAVGAGHRHGIRASPAAGHHHCGRPDLEPVAYALHNAGCIFDVRSFAPPHAGKAGRSRSASAWACAQRGGLIRATMKTNLKMIILRLRAATCIAVSLCLLDGCMVGPKYHRPATDAPAAYKELTPAEFKDTDGWKVAQPKDDALRGKWWEIFNDPQLNTLEDQVNVNNQNIASAAAAFLVARAMVKEARAQYFPTVTVGPGITASTQSGTLSTGFATGSSGGSG